MFNEQNAVEKDLSPQPPFLKGKGEPEVEPEVEMEPEPTDSGSPLPGAGRGAGGVRSPIVIDQAVSPAKVQRAKELRKNMTEAEKVLWQALRANRLNGWHFRCQQIIGGFIVDFYCHAAALAVELDGQVHAAQKDIDCERDDLIRDYGVEVIRFHNHRVFNELPQVLVEIDQICRQRTT